MPHAIRVHVPGGPEVLQWESVEVGEPGAGLVRIRQQAAGLNFIDVYHRTGLYPQPLPFTPGVEGAGVVEALGPDVSSLKVGDRVAYGGPIGGYAEERLIPADRLVKMPDAISFEHAAAIARDDTPARAQVEGSSQAEAGDSPGRLRLLSSLP